MKERIRHYINKIMDYSLQLRSDIESKDWDEQVLESERFLDAAAWLGVIMAVIYFTPIVIGIFNR